MPQKRPRSLETSAPVGQQHDVFLHGLSSVEASRRWNVLLRRQTTAAKTTATTASTLHQEEEAEDPFDCSSIAMPTSHAMADRVLDDFSKRWKQLDERRVAPPTAVTYQEVEEDEDEEEEEDNEQDAEKSSTNKTKKRKYWPAGRPRQIRLPEQFDYATRQPEPPDTNEESDRILSLLDPTVTHSYPHELWKLFQQVPTLSELEDQAKSGHAVPHMSHLYATSLESSSDKFALSRLRKKDRHDLPPTVRVLSKETTITIECWKTGLKPGPLPSSHRAVLEFQASQTLGDVHQALVELSRDDLWKQSQQHDDTTLDDSGYFFMEGIFYTVGSVDYVTPIQEWLAQSKSPNEPQGQRASYLGIVSKHNTASTPRPVLPMSEIKLQDLSLRLGVRYHHVHHGDVECAVFVVDRKHWTPSLSLSSSSSFQNTTSCTVPYPILHDIWAPSSKRPECEACRKAIACYVTSNSCALTQGNRALCQRCYQLLFGTSESTIGKESGSSNKATPSSEDDQNGDPTLADTTATHTKRKKPTMIQPFAVWRFQSDISLGANRDPNRAFG